LTENSRIFVSIAAYRDSELPQTIRDLVSHATKPENLVVAIFEQSESRLPSSTFPEGITFIHDFAPASESRGVGWARARLQQHFDGEEFYLQLDGHHRFAPGWDAKLMAEFRRCESERPIFSGYLPPIPEGCEFDPRGGTLRASHFDPEGVLHLRFHPIAGGIEGPPVRGSYLSGHFIFAPGELVRDVPYDPDFYFFGEEVSLSARAFTHGYDVFHPRRSVVWHRYGRGGARRHWDDHSSTWRELQSKSVEKWRRLFGHEPLIGGADGFGTRRSLAEFERWTGVDFRWQVIHPSALTGEPPPSKATEGWVLAEGLVNQRSVTVALPSLADEPHESVYIAIRDATPRDVFVLRQSAAEYARLREQGLTATIRFREGPLSVVVLPFFNGAWCASREWMLA
jgi:hypothetical protein